MSELSHAPTTMHISDLASPKSILQRLRDPTWDGVHALALLAGAFLGLILLTLFAETLSYEVKVVPGVLQSLVPWQYPNLRPEPWERTLYLVGVLLIPLTSIIVGVCLQWFWTKRTSTSSQALREGAIIAAILGAAWLILFASLHPGILHAEAWQAAHPWEALLPRTTGLWTLTILSAAASAAILTWAQRFPFNVHKRWLLVLEVACVGAMIVWLAVDPALLAASHQIGKGVGDAEWFRSVFHDILHGKHLLVATESQYGLLLFYIFAPFFWLRGLELSQFYLLMMLVHVLYYAGLYILLRLILRTRTEAVLAFFFILGYSYMRNQLRFEMYGEPSTTRLRNFFDIPILLCFARECRTGRARWFVAGAILTGIATFYNADVGIALAVSAAIYALASPLCRHEHFRNTAGAIAVRLSVLLGSIATIALIFSIGIVAATGEWPHWGRFLGFTQLYLAGFGSMPMPLLGTYWAVLGAYLVMALAGFFMWITGRRWRWTPLLLGLTAYGILAFNYYLNRSFVSNIWVIAMPAALGTVMLWSVYRERCAEETWGDTLTTRALKIPIVALCLLALGAAIAFDLAGVSAMASRRYGADRPPIQAAAPAWEAAFRESVAAIQRRVPPGGRAAVLSGRDALFTLAADRPNAFGYPMLETVFTIPDLERILRQFINERHQFLFVDRDPGRCPACDAVLNALAPLYEKRETAGVLDVYVRR